MLAFLLACVHPVASGLPRPEDRMYAAVLGHGDTAAFDHALVGLATAGPAALPFLPAILGRPDLEAVDERHLTDALEAFGPGAVPLLEQAVRARPPGRAAAISALARLGDPGVLALLRLAQDPALEFEVWTELRAVVSWSGHPWLTSRGRQIHPYLLPAGWFTPTDLAVTGDTLGEAACSRWQHGDRRTTALARDTLRMLGPVGCVRVLLAGGPRRAEVLDVLPRSGPLAEAAAHVVIAEVRSGWESSLAMAYVWTIANQSPALVEAALATLDDGPTSLRTVAAAALPASLSSELAAGVALRARQEGPIRGPLLRALLRSSTWSAEARDAVLAGNELISLPEAVAWLSGHADSAWLLDMASGDRPRRERLIAALALTDRDDGRWDPDPPTAPLLLDALGWARGDDRVAAVRALGTLRQDYQLRGAVLRTLLSTDALPEVRAAASHGVALAARAGFEPGPNVDALVAAVRDPDLSVRVAAAEELRELQTGIEPARVRAGLERAARDPELRVRVAAAGGP